MFRISQMRLRNQNCLNTHEASFYHPLRVIFIQQKLHTQIFSKIILDIGQSRMLAMGKEECLDRHVYNDHFHLPIDDVEQEMLWMSAFSNKPSRPLNTEQDSQHSMWNMGYNDQFESKAPATFIRSTPKMGRNDHCHCGSGVKFKKCCLT